MRFIVVLHVLILSVLALRVNFKSYKHYKVISIQGENDNLVQLQREFESHSGSVFFIENYAGLSALVAPELVSELIESVDNLELSYCITDEDFSQSMGHEKRRTADEAEFSFKTYHNVEEIHAYLHNVAQNHPHETQLLSIGNSYEGREILGIRINTGWRVKPTVMIEAGVHAREWIVPAVATYFIDQLLTSTNSNITAIKDYFDWHIFPTVNPDGYQYSIDTDRMWRKTRSQQANGCYGVDGNRNWNHNWGGVGMSNDSCHVLFCGTQPFSEIEIQNLANYASSLDNLKIYIALHSDKQVLLVPYGDSTSHLSNYDDLVKIGNAALDNGLKINSTRYGGPGTAAELLTPSSGNGIDWIHETLGIQLTYNFELRGVDFTWPPELIPEQGEEITQMILGLVTEAKALNYV